MKKRHHIVLSFLAAQQRSGFVFIMLLLLATGCKNAEEATEKKRSVYTERKAFRSVFHEANSEKMIGHYEKAEALFKQCLSIEPNNAAVHFALADLYERQRNTTQTLAYAKRAYELDTDNKWYTLKLADLYFERQEFKKTADLYAQIIAEEKNIDLKFKYTEALIRSARYDEAINMLNEIEIETGKIPEVTFTKADLYNELGQDTDIEAELNAFLADNPGNADYTIMVAEYYMQNQEFAKSVGLIEKLLVTDPNNGQAYIMMADLRLRQDDVAGAFVNLEKGFDQKDVTLERKLDLLTGLIPYTAPGQRDAETMANGVRSLFEKTYDPELKNAQLHDTYAYFYLTQNELVNAEVQYQLAADLNGTSFQSWLRLLNIQYELEKYNELYTNGAEAVELFPAQPLLYLFTGIGAKEINNLDAAEEWLFLGKDLVVKDPELASEFLYHLGDLSFKQNDNEKGERYFDQALELFPQNLTVYVDKTERYLNQQPAKCRRNRN